MNPLIKSIYQENKIGFKIYSKIDKALGLVFSKYDSQSGMSLLNVLANTSNWKENYKLKEEIFDYMIANKGYMNTNIELLKTSWNAEYYLFQWLIEQNIDDKEFINIQTELLDVDFLSDFFNERLIYLLMDWGFKKIPSKRLGESLPLYHIVCGKKFFNASASSLEFLIKNLNIDINYITSEGKTYFHYLCEKPDYDIEELNRLLSLVKENNQQILYHVDKNGNSIESILNASNGRQKNKFLLAIKNKKLELEKSYLEKIISPSFKSSITKIKI